MKWFSSMGSQERKKFRKVVSVVVIGSVMILLIPKIFSGDSVKEDNELNNSAVVKEDIVAADYPPCVKVDGVIYKDTGYCDSMVTCGTMDGEITSSVDGSKLPEENDQSNFGEEYGYQRSAEGLIVVMIDDEWRIFRDVESDDQSIPEQVKNFNAEIKEISDRGTMLVSYRSMPEGFLQMSAGEYIIPMDNVKEELKNGDIVTIWFDGKIMETYPMKLGTVYCIEKTDLSD